MEQSERFCLVSKMRNFVILTLEEEAVLASFESRQQHFASRSLVYAEQTLVSESFIVRDGWFATFSMLANGKRSLTNLYLRGDLIGMASLPHLRHTSGLMSLTTGSLYVLPSYCLGRVLDSFPRLASLLSGVEIQENLICMDRIRSCGRIAAKDRLILFLLQIHSRQVAIEDRHSLTLLFPLTQEQIGDFIGLTTVYVNRLLKELSTQGLVRLEGHTLTICDRQSMIDLCDFHDRYQQIDMTRLPGLHSDSLHISENVSLRGSKYH